MSRVSIIALALLLALTAAPAGAADSEDASKTTPPGADNPHHRHDQHLRACRLQAKRARLGGQGREQFIARCLKNSAAIDAPPASADHH